MFKKLRIKLFGRSKKELTKDMNYLIAEIADYLDDIEYDLDELHESVNESLRLTLIVQEQCNEIISKMEKNNTRKDERTLEEIVDNIENIISNMENEDNGEEDKNV